MPDDSLNNSFEEAKLKAMRVLSYGSKSKDALYDKLLDADFTNDAAAAAVACMEELGYINDERMALDYVAYAVESKAFGRARIVNDLCRKGISESIAEAAYDKYEQDRRAEPNSFDFELQNAVQILQKRLRQLGLDADDLDYGDYRRLKGFLHRRGFDFDLIDKAFKELKED